MKLLANATINSELTRLFDECRSCQMAVAWASVGFDAFKQFNKADIDDLEKHFKGKIVRVIGLLARHDYRGKGSIPEVEIVLDDMSQIEVVK